MATYKWHISIHFVCGIICAIFTLSKLILFLLHSYPVHIWSFFFGLIVASAILMIRTISNWTAPIIATLLAGTILAYYIAGITTMADENTSLWYVFLCGAVAICAMILPGISGSFILLLMGTYELIIGTIKSIGEALISGNILVALKQVPLVLVFAVGCLLGLTSFSRVLTWLFKHHHNMVVALLIGFLFGSLNKVWPWKETIQQIGEKHKIEANITPWEYATLNTETFLPSAIALCVLGLFIVLGTEWIASRLKSDTQQ